MNKILVVDDNKAVLNFINLFLLQSGKFDVETLDDSTKAYEYIEKGSYDILLLDMDMPEVTGLDILHYIYEKKIRIITIVLTGVEDIDLAISAMKLGTYDYVLKPIDEEKILSILNNAIDSIAIDRSSESSMLSLSRKNLTKPECFKEIITQDEEMLKIFHLIEKYAITDNSVLIWGESGTGKELIARAIHNISNRKNNKFVAVNAGVFANDLFASEFFGHEKGAFTGAVSNKKGLIEEADGGTLFLDEIGELSLSIQVKLLRFLQEEEFYRLGSTKNQKANVRIIAATNKNLFEEIKNGSFRKDLFFRLNINSINLPPLRDRYNDIEILAIHFLELFNKKFDRKILSISKQAMNFLKTYSYPGNIRELMNIINSAIIIETSNELRRKSMPHYLIENNSNSFDFHDSNLPLSLQDIEKEHIQKILKFTSNNRSKASEILGISRVNLIAKIKKYGLE